jgi:hypothetical protein
MGQEKTQHAHDLVAALSNARWSYNPHDIRGQGNMGKPGMQDPFGFDKDSGREKSERGRPMKNGEESEAPVENPAVPVEETAPEDEIVEEEIIEEQTPVEDQIVEQATPQEAIPVEEITIDDIPMEILVLMDPYIDYLRGIIAEAEAMAQLYPQYAPYADYVVYAQGFLDNYIQEHSPQYIAAWTTEVPTSLDANRLVGVDFTQLIDFSTLEDPNIQMMLAQIEEAKTFWWTPTYVTYIEKFMNNYFITNYTEYATQLLDTVQ